MLLQTTSLGFIVVENDCERYGLGNSAGIITVIYHTPHADVAIDTECDSNLAIFL